MAELAAELGHGPDFYRRVADEIAAKIGESPETVLKLLRVATKHGMLRRAGGDRANRIGKPAGALVR